MTSRLASRIAVALLLLFAQGGATARAQATASWADRASFEYEVVPNITYRTANNVDLKLDLYLPPNRKVPVPVVMSIHGGGWVVGTKEAEALTFLPYLAMGWAVANVEYRLAGSSLAPAAVEDCRCALAWIVQNAQEKKLDPRRVVTTGYSAGGHLALTTGMLPASAGFHRACGGMRTLEYWVAGAPPPLPAVAAIVNGFGITDVAGMLEGAPNARGYAIEWLGSIANPVELARRISPLDLVRPGLPPVLTIHGDADPVVPYSDAVRLHAALQKAGVPNQLLTIAGGKHGDFSSAENDRIWATVREFLGKQGLAAVP